ncbi:MAG: hypothetical protein GY811_23875 [Myxococcales bacterium]|nr:hypothetical protein [Myxococcales bacterium]
MKAASLLVACAAALGAENGAASAETARGSYLHADPSRVDIGSATSHTSNVIYLNGCFGSGCDFSPGNESSIENTSSLIDAPRHVPPFSGGQMQWDAIVDCVRDTYKPFDIEITDQDPGNEPHFEAIVAGEASDIGMVGLIGGLAPFLCGETINNAITFSFAALVDNDVAETCWVIAQETAHAFGLDHEYLCSDPMSYLRSCDYNKRFQDEDAPCGEFGERECSCGGPTQNSYRRLLEHFGPGVATPPTVAIDSPANGDEVEAGFIVRTRASDNLRVDRVELRVNSVIVGVSESEPYIFNVPETISDGRLRLEVTAYDNYDYQGAAIIEVIQGEPCDNPGDCAGLETCVSGRCVPGPDAEDGLGQQCLEAADCASGRCGTSKSTSVCTEVCNGACTCPSGFGCRTTDDGSECWPGYDDNGGCSTGVQGGAGGLATWFLAALLLFLCRRRLLG